MPRSFGVNVGFGNTMLMGITRMVAKPLRGVGRIVHENTVLREQVPYRLVVDGDDEHRISGRVEFDQPRVVEMIRSVAAHGSSLVLELEDGQRLNFAFRNTEGGIASSDEPDT